MSIWNDRDRQVGCDPSELPERPYIGDQLSHMSAGDLLFRAERDARDILERWSEEDGEDYPSSRGGSVAGR